MEDLNTELLDLFKALADANRLKIIGLLTQRPYSGEELVVLLGVKASTISHHLSKLVKVGLVSAQAEGYYNVYHLQMNALQKTRKLFSKKELFSVAAGVDLDGYDQKVINDFTKPDGSLKEIPAQRKKLEAILRYVVRDFKFEQNYSENQVNQILIRFHPDTASLRRELVGSKFMERETAGGAYWRLQK